MKSESLPLKAERSMCTVSRDTVVTNGSMSSRVHGVNASSWTCCGLPPAPPTVGMADAPNCPGSWSPCATTVRSAASMKSHGPPGVLFSRPCNEQRLPLKSAGMESVCPQPGEAPALDVEQGAWSFAEEVPLSPFACGLAREHAGVAIVQEGLYASGRPPRDFGHAAGLVAKDVGTSPADEAAGLNLDTPLPAALATAAECEKVEPSEVEDATASGDDLQVLDLEEVKEPHSCWHVPVESPSSPLVSVRTSKGDDESDVNQSPSMLGRITSRTSMLPSRRHGPRRNRRRDAKSRGSKFVFLVDSSWYDGPLILLAAEVLRSRLMLALTTLCIFAAIFTPDTMVLLEVPTNTAQDVVLTVVFSIFVFEFFLLCISQATYPLSFFFWMDMLGNLSIILDLSFILAPDSTKPSVVTSENEGSENIVIIRAARAAKLGTRAGRLTRTIKLLKHCHRPLNEPDARQTTANRITNQLVIGVASRVSFLVLCVAVTLPVIYMFGFPEADESMPAWTQLIDEDVIACFASQGNATDYRMKLDHLNEELDRFRDFFRNMNYGPFMPCFREFIGGEFRCNEEGLPGTLSGDSWGFTPRRWSLVTVFGTDHFQVSFDLTQPNRLESASSIAVLVIVVMLMSVFGLSIGGSVGKLTLKPIMHVMALVTKACAGIDTISTEWGDTVSEAEEDEVDNELTLLTTAIAKLGVLATRTEQRQDIKHREHDEMMEQYALACARSSTADPVDSALRTSAMHSTASSRAERLPTHISVAGDWANYCATQEAQEAADKLELRALFFSDIVSDLLTDGFDPVLLDDSMRASVALHLLQTAETTSAWVGDHICPERLRHFIRAVWAQYESHSYHNFAHAVDVLQNLARYMSLIAASSFLREELGFGLLLAGIGHDLGHPGVSNVFLVETMNELALKYNDSSVLENMHACRLFLILDGRSSAEANVLCEIDRATNKLMRSHMIQAILHTDVAHHNEMTRSILLMVKLHEDEFAQDGGKVAEEPQADGEKMTDQRQSMLKSDLQLVMNALLHCADISNPMRPWAVCERWAFFVLQEFFAQGDKEKLAGIPVGMLNDREKVNRPNSQIGFIEFIITPFAEAIVQLLPTLDSLAAHLAFNVRRWSEVWQQEEAEPSPEAIAKLNERTQKVANRCQAVLRWKQTATTEL
eukprot:TRINITY_DN41918_c0_g1_i1.p1 TRINITY_DN41918_c0_g1~~TRINITY_DN41918_c0_g1_i1.p1  ORF type:complete len:1162 (-),score=190.73 TRINITY_DN41918_c0_g1_i1:49-3534(-)